MIKTTGIYTAQILHCYCTEPTFNSSTRIMMVCTTMFRLLTSLKHDQLTTRQPTLQSTRMGYSSSFVPISAPFSSKRQHLSELWWVSGSKRGDYQDCSVLYCVSKLCTVISTLRWAVLTVLWIGFCHTGPISLCVDSVVFMCLYFVFFTAYMSFMSL